MNYEEKLKDAMHSFSPIRQEQDSFLSGIEWHESHSWHRNEEGDLPPLGEVVIVAMFDIDDNGDFIYDDEPMVCFGHRTDEVGVMVDENLWSVIMEGTKVAYWCSVPSLNVEFVDEVKSCLEKR